LVAGTEGYAFGISSIAQGSSGGTTSAVAAYDASGSAHGSGLDATLRQIASSNGTANGAVLTLKAASAISGSTPAANDYTDTITVIGAGNF
jgi:spore coat protein U-like protein